MPSGLDDGPKTLPRLATMYRSQKIPWVRPSVQSSTPWPLPNSSAASRKLMNTIAVTQPGLRTSATPTISKNMYGRSWICKKCRTEFPPPSSGVMNWSPMTLS